RSARPAAGAARAPRPTRSWRGWWSGVRRVVLKCAPWRSPGVAERGGAEAQLESLAGEGRGRCGRSEAEVEAEALAAQSLGAGGDLDEAVRAGSIAIARGADSVLAAVALAVCVLGAVGSVGITSGGLVDLAVAVGVEAVAGLGRGGREGRHAGG